MAKTRNTKKTTETKKRGRGHPKTDTSPKQYTGDNRLPPHKILAHYTPGRPTEYKPEYCVPLIEHMADGYSFESFAACVAVSSDTLYTWVSKHEEFAEAKKIGFQLNRVWWETTSKSNAAKNTGNAAGIRFNMINRFRGEWTDSQHVDMTTKGKELKAPINLNNVSEDTIRRLLNEAEGSDDETSQG